MKIYSPALMSALLGMSVITHAYADTNSLTPEQVEKMYFDEMKLPGKTLRCFQAGQEIIHEPGLQNVSAKETRVSGVRVDGSPFEVLLSDGIACTIVTYKPSK